MKAWIGYGIICTTIVIEVNILIEGAQLNEDKRYDKYNFYLQPLFTNHVFNIACHCIVENNVQEN